MRNPQRVLPFCGVSALLLLVSPVAALAQGFGGAVAYTDGDFFAGHTSNTNKSGVVYVYSEADDGSWAEAAQITASDATGDDDRFGRALHTAGDFLFVGATTRDKTKGAVYVFKKIDGVWTEAAMLIPAGVEEGDAFGRSIAMSRNFLLVGAAGSDNVSGAAYVYRYDPESDTWHEHTRLKPDGLEDGDLFGLVVAIDGSSAIVSAIKQGRSPGEVYAFRYDETTDKWSSDGQLKVDSVDARAGYGFSLGITGSNVLVGAPNEEGMGAVHAFAYNTTENEWQHESSLTPDEAEAGYGFATAISVNDGIASIGAPGANGSGAVFRYRPDAGSWTFLEAVQAPNDASGFGGAMAFLDDMGLVGMPGADFTLGRAVLVERKGSEGWTKAAEFFVDVETLDSITGGQVDCAEGDAGGFGCQKVNLLSFLSSKDLGAGRGARLNDIWGWTDPETGKEWALVGRMDGTSFVDVSDPYNPVFVGELPKTEGTRANSWRDIKVYADHAFIVADGVGQHGVQVFDLGQLRDVTEMPTTFEETARYEGIASAHNIVINEDTGFAYSVGSNSGGDTCGGGLHMIDVRDPANPTFAGCFSHTDTGRSGTGYTHDAQCVVYNGPDADYKGREICFGSNETALSIADVTDKDNPIALSATSYPNVGYAHQGWLTEDHRHFLMDDELDELSGSVDGTRTLIWDVSELDDPQLILEYISENPSSDHNLYVKGNYVYQSNYVSGLRILDISDILNPVEVGHFDTVVGQEDAAGFAGSWSNYPFFKSGIIVLTSGQEGLFVVQKNPELGL